MNSGCEGGNCFHNKTFPFMRILAKDISVYVFVHMYMLGIQLGYLRKVPVILQLDHQHMPKQVQVTRHKMKYSSSHCSDCVGDNSS